MSASAASEHAQSLGVRRGGVLGAERLLGEAWGWPRTGLWSSVLVLMRGPAPPRGWPVGPYFPDAWIRSRANWKLLFLSALLHILVVIFPLRLRFFSHSAGVPPPQQLEVAWMGSSKVLLPYIPAFRKDSRKRAPHTGENTARPGTVTSHPKQTIISNPEVATHPRQTLIEPAAPPEPPKILTPLPEIVEWPNLPKPAAPRRHLRVNERARMRQKITSPKPRIDAPEIRAAVPEMTFTSEHPDLVKPALEVKANARPTFAAEHKQEEAAPDIRPVPAADLAGQKLIALSETPAPPPPNLEVPVGNLAAQFAMSPDAKSPGAAGNTPTGSGIAPASKRAGSGRGGEIPGIAIVGGARGPVSNIAGPPGKGGNGLGLSALPRGSDAPHQPGVAATPSEATRTPTASIQERIKSAVHPEDLLEPGRIYTLHVNMPNLASVTGTWTLKFVELDENGKEIPGTIDSQGIAGPEPMRKVDPKYPPAFISARVQGDVILYAIIRRDGSVDSIEVVRSLEPQLDQNAMEAFARWKFRAAQREGRAVELAAVVRIPFRATSPAF